MSAYWMLAIVMGLNGIALGLLAALGNSALMARHRSRIDVPRRVPNREHVRNRIINSVVSTAQVFGFAYLFHDQLIVAADQSAARILLEIVGMLALYDFGYYVLHRFVFHQWSVGRRLHGVHHRIRTPYVNDSIFVHPLETVLGLSLFFGCVLAVGPVSVYALGLGFFVYSVWNLLIHSAFHLPFFPFRWVSAVVANHDVHHTSMRAGYYASLTPLYDWLLGTATDNVGPRTQA